MRLIYDNSGIAAVLSPAPKFLEQLEGTENSRGFSYSI